MDGVLVGGQLKQVIHHIIVVAGGAVGEFGNIVAYVALEFHGLIVESTAWVNGFQGFGEGIVEYVVEA